MKTPLAVLLAMQSSLEHWGQLPVAVQAPRGSSMKGEWPARRGEWVGGSPAGRRNGEGGQGVEWEGGAGGSGGRRGGRRGRVGGWSEGSKGREQGIRAQDRWEQEELGPPWGCRPPGASPPHWGPWSASQYTGSQAPTAQAGLHLPGQGVQVLPSPGPNFPGFLVKEACRC